MQKNPQKNPITLVGFPGSNYYNKAKMVLLEKGIAFDERLSFNNRTPEALAKSPLGKIPYIETPQGSLSESQCIVDYLESAYAQTPLLPTDPWAAAKVQELCTFLDLHIELVVRRLYPQAFFGGRVAPEVIEATRVELVRNVQALKRLTQFSPFIAGAQFTMADCCAAVHLPVASMATKAMYGEDLMAPLEAKEYLALMKQRPSVQRVDADRKAGAAAMAEAFRPKT